MKRLVIIFLMAGFGASAQVYKCRGPGGNILYQQEPCPGEPNTKPMELSLPPPEVLLRMQQEADERELRNQAETEAKAERESNTVETDADGMAPEINAPPIEYVPIFIDDGYPRYLPLYNFFHPPFRLPAVKDRLKDADSIKRPPRRFKIESHRHTGPGKRRR
ncbi:MAG: DUF4124 domain-containing protein [Gammaproteobacteria bacterium]